MDVLAESVPRDVSSLPPLSSLAPHVAAQLVRLERLLVALLDRVALGLAPSLAGVLPEGSVGDVGALEHPSEVFCQAFSRLVAEGSVRGRALGRELSERTEAALASVDPAGRAAGAFSDPRVVAAWHRVAWAASCARGRVCGGVASAASLALASLEKLSPLETLLLGALLALALSRVISWLCALRRSVQDRGLGVVLVSSALGLPLVRWVVKRKVAEAGAELEASERSKRDPDALTCLPERGWSVAQVERRLDARSGKDVAFTGISRVSGAVYMAGEEHKRLLMRAYESFALSNPLHADVFPSARAMEVEVVRMTASMFGGGPGGPAPSVCGAMTSGGSESIFLAVKVAREVALRERGVRGQPEILAPVSAHAAFVKAAEYFGLRLRSAPLDPATGTVDLAAMASMLSRNTALLVASCPGFPHGVMDPVREISELARRHGTLCHVDCCLGGFVVPFRRRLGLPTPPFDFALPGVTSISADTHKFGMAHKGTSVVLYRSRELRKHQFTAVTDWTGGLYISPGPAGSRSGALIATAWASMVHLGWSGYCDLTRRLLDATKRLREGIEAIEHLRVLGDPIASVVAFRAADPKRLNIYLVNDGMVERGWHLNPLQKPAAVHVCLTAAHLDPDAVTPLLKDLEDVVQKCLGAPAPKKGAGSAPIYGAAATVPDPSIVGAVLEAYQNVMLDEC